MSTEQSFLQEARERYERTERLEAEARAVIEQLMPSGSDLPLSEERKEDVMRSIDRIRAAALLQAVSAEQVTLSIEACKSTLARALELSTEEKDPDLSYERRSEIMSELRALSKTIRRPPQPGVPSAYDVVIAAEALGERPDDTLRTVLGGVAYNFDLTNPELVERLRTGGAAAFVGAAVEGTALEALPEYARAHRADAEAVLYDAFQEAPQFLPHLPLVLKNEVAREEYGWYAPFVEEYSARTRAENFERLMQRVQAMDPEQITGEGEIHDLHGRTFGAELEVVFPDALDSTQRAKLAEAMLERLGLVAIGLDSEGAAGRKYEKWQVTLDGSVKNGTFGDSGAGLELVSPVLEGEGGQREYRRVLQALQAIGAEANDTCGAHFHVGCLDMLGPGEGYEMQKALIRSYAYNEARLDGFVAPRRAEGKGYGARRYVDRSDGFRRAREWERLEDALDNPPPVTEGVVEGVTPAAWATGSAGKDSKLKVDKIGSASGTVEFRQLEGHLDPERGLQWLAAMTHLVHEASVAPERVATLEHEDKTGRLRPAKSISRVAARLRMNGVEGALLNAGREVGLAIRHVAAPARQINRAVQSLRSRVTGSLDSLLAPEPLPEDPAPSQDSPPSESPGPRRRH